jgi:ligand-binding sensor domain-containing protein
LGNAWLALNPDQGGGLLVYNKTNGQSVYLTESTNQGLLPSRNVYSLESDRSGQMWVGTGLGVAYFPDPGRVFSGVVNSIKPIFEGRFLLRDERVTAIVVDGGNRKWMGTERGVWLVDALGETEFHNFNESNSPLLSSIVNDIEIHPVTGEIFFSTPRGIVSYRADATTGKAQIENVKIFPNPVTASFNGLVGISGLTTDAIVKITDVAGKLVWQTTANGGTASWNVRDYNGRRPSTGIYLVFSIKSDGTESIVGKIAVVN